MRKSGKVSGRWQLLYALIMITVIFGLLHSITAPIEISPGTKAVYNYINDDSKLTPGSPVLIEICYDEVTKAELEPQVIAIMKQLSNSI